MDQYDIYFLEMQLYEPGEITTITTYYGSFL